MLENFTDGYSRFMDGLKSRLGFGNNYDYKMQNYFLKKTKSRYHFLNDEKHKWTHKYRSWQDERFLAKIFNKRKYKNQNKQLFKVPINGNRTFSGWFWQKSVYTWYELVINYLIWIALIVLIAFVINDFAQLHKVQDHVLSKDAYSSVLSTSLIAIAVCLLVLFVSLVLKGLWKWKQPSLKNAPSYKGRGFH